MGKTIVSNPAPTFDGSSYKNVIFVDPVATAWNINNCIPPDPRMLLSAKKNVFMNKRIPVSVVV